jgi:hypothetical protein
MTDNPQTTEALIRRAIKLTADYAWGIAFKGKAAPEICLAIECLSDDPERNEKLVAEILQP